MKTAIHKREVINKIKLDLANAGLSQYELAKHLSLTETSVSRKLNGHTSITLIELVKIAELTGKEIIINY